MGNNTLIRGVIIGIVSLIIIVIVAMVLIGENSIINQEVNNYNDTHIEEKTEKQNNEAVKEK